MWNFELLLVIRLQKVAASLCFGRRTVTANLQTEKYHNAMPVFKFPLQEYPKPIYGCAEWKKS